MVHYYTLEGHTPVPCPDLDRFVAWAQTVNHPVPWTSTSGAAQRGRKLRRITRRSSDRFKQPKAPEIPTLFYAVKAWLRLFSSGFVEFYQPYQQPA